MTTTAEDVIIKQTERTPVVQPPAYEDKEVQEIDLLELLGALRKRFWALLLAALIGASVAAAATLFLMTPMYTSSSMMIVLTKETTIASLADLQLGAQLTKDYSVLITSRPVLEETIKNVGLDEDYKELRKQITVTNAQDTRILNLSVTQPDPKMAKRVVDELADVSAAYIADKMEVQAPKIVEEGEIPLEQTSPSMEKNLLIGFLIGALIAAAMVCVREIMNDAIITEEDVSRYLGLTTLAVVPDKSGTGSKKTKKNARARRKGTTK